MDPLDRIATVDNLVETCSQVTKRIYDLTGESKPSGDPILDTATETMTLAESFEHLGAILSRDKSARSLEFPKAVNMPSSESVDQALHRIFRLCQITLSALSLELDKIAGSGAETSGVRVLIVKTKLVLRTHKMKEFLEHLRVYREALAFQIQILTL
jgi:hypothetical protein